MNRNHIGSTLLASLVVCGLVACTTQESGSGGTGGSIAPTGTGGTTGGGGSTGASGLGTLCPAPAQVLTDFAFNADAGAADIRFGGGGTLSGGGSIYPATAMKQDLTQGSWHISGTVGDYSGFGLYFDNCDRVDASKYKGISFTLSGAAPGGITMMVGTAGDTANATWMAANGKTTAKTTDVGRCTPSQNTSNQYYTPGCSSPAKQIVVPATASTISVLWSDFTGGTPEASVTPSEITSIAWNFQWSGSGTPYAVDIVMDDLAFIP
jgi:hypothetical protein